MQVSTLPLSRRRHAILAMAAVLLVATDVHGLRAATIQTGNVTTALGPTFFVDDATNGGGDADINQPTVASYVRRFSGLLTPGMGPARVTLTGFGFAAHTDGPSNDATSLTVAFTYLGADEAVGGGDDVAIGSTTGSYVHTAGGEYVFAFDAPLTADLNLTGVRFRIQLTPTNGSNNGSLKLKTGPLTYEATNGAKFSVAGFVTPLGVNLAKFQPVTVDSTNGQFLASYVTDGRTGTFNRWQSVSGSSPHWARVDFPFPVEIGSAQVFTGTDDANPQTNFRIQYLSGTSWLDMPGGVITGNTNVERNIVFTTAVTASSFRIHTGDGTLRVRELALYPPNGGIAFPLGGDLTLNLAHQRPAVANARTAGNFALHAVDGRVNKDSKWQTSTAGANSLEIDLSLSTDSALNVKIGSAHLYTGSPGVAPLADFVLKYWDGSAWQNIPGGSVTGNTAADLVIPFTTPVTTGKVRLEFTNPGTTSVRELCVFPANTGNTGYPIGTNVTGAPPLTAKADDYSDSFYQITNPAASRYIAVGNDGQPALHSTGITTAQGQYQILLNLSDGTYRLRNRATGNCLSGAGFSKTTGSLMGDEPYIGSVYQNWILDPLDGGAFQLINQWSGLALDIQGGGTAAGTALVQNAPNGSASQRWTMVYHTWFPKKGIGGTSFGTSFNANWAYNWGLTSSHLLPAGAVFNPMQWGNFNWTYNTSAASTWKLYPAWRASAQPLYLMGFNEPDAWSQSGDSLDTQNTNEADFSTTRSMQRAVDLWPRLQAMDLPLVSPAAAYNIAAGWLDQFYTNAENLGYRVDYTALHTYPGPSGGSSDGLINFLETAYNDWARPVWLTEFSFVDWNKESSWSEEDCYNCLAEFLWRAESLPWLRKYALFVFTEDANNPQPANAWSTSVTTGGAPRSNARDINGDLTAFGKLYAAWDNDATVRQNKTYYFHNKQTRKRIANNTAQTSPAGRNIRIDGRLVHWTFVDAPTSGRYHIVSSLDGRRLSTDGTTVSLVAAGTTGTAVEWTRAATTPAIPGNPDGWFYIGHPASGKRLRMAYNNSTLVATYTMEPGSSTGDDVRWRFIVPPAPPVWSGAVGNSWTDAPNWIPGVPPASGDAITFNNSSTANLATMLDQNFDPSGISVVDPAGPVSIGGTHNLTLGSGGFDLANASQNLTVTAPLTLSAAQDWNVASGRALNVNGPVSGAYALNIAGAGTVTLGAAVDPLTSITVSAGSTLKKGASGVLASGVAAVTPTVSGTLDLNGTTQSVNAIAGSGVIDNTAAPSAQLTVGNHNAAVTLNAQLQDTVGNLALVKTGTGTLTLPSAKTFAGGLTNNGTGNIVPQNNSAFGTGPVVMNSATIYATTASFTFGNELTLNGATLRIGGSGGKTITWTGPVNITGNSFIQCDGGTGGITLSGGVNIDGGTLNSAPNGTANTISAPISGTGTIAAASFSTGILNLNAANPFSGTYRAALGTLRIGDANALQNGTLDMNASDSGAVNLNNLNAVIGALTGSRNLGLGNGTVSIGNNHASTSYSGVLSGTGSLVKTGTGTLTLSGSNHYTGTTAIQSGALALGANDALPGTALSIGNATLDAATFSDAVGSLAIAGNATINLGGGASLAFAASNAVPWSGALNITGTFVSGQSLRFGANGSALLPAQLALITVNGIGPFTLNSTGYLIEASADPYDLWKTQITNGLDERGEDADGDGLANLGEFLFGTPPMSGNAPPVTTTSSGGNLTLRWLQREGGATYLLRQSTTLANGSWSTVVSPVPAMDGNQTGAPESYDFHTVTIPAGPDSRFYRIEAFEN